MAPETYEAFLDRVQRLNTVQDAAGVLRWDQEVVMPDGGTTARAQQLSSLSSISHELLTDEQMTTWINELDNAELDAEQQAVFREVNRQHERSAAVPRDLIEEISEQTSEAHPIWMEARSEDEFDQFAPVLEELINLKREYANYIDPDRDPYEVLFEDYEPYLGLETADQILTNLRDGLVPMIDAIRESDVALADPFSGTFDTDTQEALSRDVLDTLGYDWEHGRLDTSPHPFTSGTQFDARITTRFDETDPLGALLSTIHEFGHATYAQGLPQDEYGTPLGDSRDMSVHESQSRFWENHIGRTKPFWETFLPTMADRFSSVAGTSPQAAYEAANTVDPDNLIRVEADELTYHLHIIIRYEIERALLEDDLDVEEVPAVWNDKYEDYLGVRPETDTNGCLQDIHWSHGDFGYFPTYSLGSVLAAQLNAAMREDLAVDTLIRDADFDPIHDWLTDEIHQHGSRYTTDELIRRATGNDLSATPFLNYARQKYGSLYDLDL